jgi:hypothetical protein
MLRSILNQKHDAYDADLWGDYDALYAGGKKFFDRVRRFLHQHPNEPALVYLNRIKEAHYRCYHGGIIDYFASFLFQSSLVVRARKEGSDVVIDPDPFYGEFKEDCDARDNDIHVFLRSRVIEAMNKKVSWWVVEMPEPPDEISVETLKEWKDQGLDKARVRALGAEQVLDWEVDEDGHMTWAIVQSVRIVRPTPGDKRKIVIERYDVYDREFVEHFELQYEKNKKPSKDIDVPSISKKAHGFGTVPLVNIDVGDSLWLANRVASPQIEHFRLSNALTWGIRRTCYAMPVFKLLDQDKPPTMGPGYYIMIGKDESFEWAAPPGAPYQAIREEVKDQKDEIFRVVHQMAMGVDNNAAAVGRSGKSKEVDQAAVKVVLSALGQIVRESVERTYSLLSDGRGEKYEWAIEGLDCFVDVDLTELVTSATMLQMLSIPSPTFQREIKTRVALAAVPDAEQASKDDIRQEIEDNVTDESVLNPPPLPGEEPDEPDPADDKPNQEDKGKAGGTPPGPKKKPPEEKPKPKPKPKPQKKAA